MHQDEETEAGDEDREDGGVAIRNVTESIYPGRDPVIVRTTHLHGPPGRETRIRAGLRRMAREGRTTSLTG
jgi:hypothetical protein